MWSTVTEARVIVKASPLHLSGAADTGWHSQPGIPGGGGQGR